MVKNLPANAGRHKRCRFSPWVGKIPWRRACNPFQYSCLENPVDRGAWRATVHRVTKSQTRLKWLNMHACIVDLQCCISLKCAAKEEDKLDPVVGKASVQEDVSYRTLGERRDGQIARDAELTAPLLPKHFNESWWPVVIVFGSPGS